MMISVMASVASTADEGPNLLEEGDFEATKGGVPIGFIWSGFAGDASITPNTFEVVSGEESQYVRLTVPQGTDKTMAWVETAEPIPLMPEWVDLQAKVKMRISQYLQGDQGWHGVKVFFYFLDENGKKLTEDLAVIKAGEDKPDWEELTGMIRVPLGAKAVGVKAGIIGSSGVVEVDDLRVGPVQ